MLVKGCYAADLFLDIKYIDLYPVLHILFPLLLTFTSYFFQF